MMSVAEGEIELHTQSRNRRHIGMNHSNSNLSKSYNDDMIIEILLRLPVKSLVRFRSVSKSWNTLISDHDFIKSHLKRSLLNNPSNKLNVLIIPEPEFRMNYALSCRNPNMDKSFLGPDFVFVGCCNGILCYYRKFGTSNLRSVLLWNPATNQYRVLPEGRYRGSSCHEVLVFFVSDPVNDDYKVVKILHRRHPSLLKGEVYSLSTNSWKKINLRSFPSKRMVGSNMVVHNGALYCITIRKSSGHQAVLTAFYIDDERCDEVSLPICKCKTKPMPRLGTFKEFLSLLVWREDYEMWVMKENGVWTKQLALVNTPDIHSPYGMTASGKIIAFNWQGEDVVYDVESLKVEEFVQNKVVFIKANINYLPDTDINNVIVSDYVQSLISLLPPAETMETTNNQETAPLSADV